MPRTLMPTIPYYEKNAEQLESQYESLAFEDVHAGLLDLLPKPGSTVIDMGAGSGGDAAWYASRGYDVIAVEPSAAMRARGRQLHQTARIIRIDDSLPDLVLVRRQGLTFDLILISAA